VVAQGSGQVGELAAACADPAGARIPAPLAGARAPLAELWRDLERRIAARDRQILDCGRRHATFRHLLNLPGFGPVLASAMAAIAGFALSGYAHVSRRLISLVPKVRYEMGHLSA